MALNLVVDRTHVYVAGIEGMEIIDVSNPAAPQAVGHFGGSWNDIRIVNDAAMRIEASARQALAAIVEGDTLRVTLAALRRLLKTTPVNAIEMRRRLADQAVTSRGYIF